MSDIDYLYDYSFASTIDDVACILRPVAATLSICSFRENYDAGHLLLARLLTALASVVRTHFFDARK